MRCEVQWILGSCKSTQPHRGISAAKDNEGERTCKLRFRFKAKIVGHGMGLHWEEEERGTQQIFLIVAAPSKFSTFLRDVIFWELIAEPKWRRIFLRDVNWHLLFLYISSLTTAHAATTKIIFGALRFLALDLLHPALTSAHWSVNGRKWSRLSFSPEWIS